MVYITHFRKKDKNTAMKHKIDPKSRMHSAEHLLNQTMVRMFNCGRCFSAHIEKKKSKCDYHFDRSLTEKETREIEKRAIIDEDVVVRRIKKNYIGAGFCRFRDCHPDLGYYLMV